MLAMRPSWMCLAPSDHCYTIISNTLAVSSSKTSHHEQIVVIQLLKLNISLFGFVSSACFRLSLQLSEPPRVRLRSKGWHAPMRKERRCCK